MTVRSYEITRSEAGRRLDNVLGSILGKVPKSLIYKIIRRGEVRVNGSRAKPGRRVAIGDVIRIPPVAPDAPVAPRLEAARIAEFEQRVLFENETAIVIDKPAGMAVHGGTGLRFGVVDIVRQMRPHAPAIDLVHRLDRQTSGCLILAKEARFLTAVHAQFRDGRVKKSYTALIRGRLGRDVAVDAGLRMQRVAGERRAVVDKSGKQSRSTFHLEELLPDASLVSVGLATGRTHQIRAHAEYIGHPLAGDDRYGDHGFNRKMTERGLRRLFLHAENVEFDAFRDGQPVSVQAPLPPDLSQFLARLRDEQT